MKTALVVSSLRMGGTERVVSTMANHWAAKSWEVAVVTIAGREERPFFDLDPGVELIPLGVAGLSRSVLAALASNATRVRAVRRALATFRPDAVISFGDSTNVVAWLAAQGLRIPIVLSQRIDPSKYEGVSRSKTGYAYQATPAWLLTRILERLNLDYRSYVFLDLGSGMGRAVMMAAEFPFARIAGVELSPGLHQIARENLKKWKSRKRRCESIELVCMDALEYPLPLSNTVLYMFNPFTEASMRPLLDRVAASLREKPREMYIIYVNPVLKGLLDESGLLETVMTGELFAVYRAVRR